MEFGPSELEQLLCSPLPLGVIDRLAPWISDAWSVRFPDLRSLPLNQGEFKPLKICIATEDIVGPVRNGGIGTTYAALAELLAKLGHHSTILYLKGQEVETGDINQWIDFYAEKGVNFVPVPNYAVRDDIRTNADRWLRAPYNMLRYLIENPMDVVHVSEWRGSGYLSLLAKRQGLAFENTLFVVKTSSPWMWNRLYGSQPLERLDDLAKIHAERQSVELADMVIGGSLHLLRWMSSQGYRIPRARTFVQPNVATFDSLRDLMGKRPVTVGTRMPINEIVFFGRLEARKGLFVFCQAIKRLIRQGVELPPQISFMGKPGAKLTARPNQGIIEYIEEETRDWPTKVNILTQFQQYEAIQYLLEAPRLAVMPSIIENSSMAIYEAAICSIPCVASSSGGNPELIAPEDRQHVMCEPHPLALGDKIREALELGGYVPRPSFDNDANLETWRDFHKALGAGLREQLLAGSRLVRRDGGPLRTSVCVYFTGQQSALMTTLRSLKDQEAPAYEILVAVDADKSNAADDVAALAREIGVEVKITETFDLDSGASFNALAQDAEGEFLLFLWEGSTLRPHALRALGTVAQTSGAEVLNYFYHVVERKQDKPPYLKALVLGSTTDSFFRNDITAFPLYVQRQKFLDLNGFTSDYRVLCAEHEFVAKAQLAGAHCETVLLELGEVSAWDDEWLSRKGYDIPVSHFRAIRPKLAAVPLGLRDLLLVSKGLQIKPPGGAKGQAKARQPSNDDATVDTAFARIMDGILAQPKPAPRKPAPGAGPRQPPPKPASSPDTGLLRLIDNIDSNAKAVIKQAAEAKDSAEVAAAKPDATPVAADPADDQPAAPKPTAKAAPAAVPAKPKPARQEAGKEDAETPSSSAPVQPPKVQKSAPPRVKIIPEPVGELEDDGDRVVAAAPEKSAEKPKRAGPPRLGNNLVRSGSLAGEVLAVYEGTLIGWVADLDRPDRKIELVLNIDGQDQPTVHVANQSLSLAGTVPDNVPGHCFSIPLRAGTGGKPLMKVMSLLKPGGAPMRVTLRTTDGMILTQTVVIPSASATLQSIGFQGYCDPSDDGVFKGWAWRPSDRDYRLDIAVFVDKKFLARVNASRYREDVQHEGHGDGEYGFDVAIPKQYREGGRHQVEAVVADVGLPLGRSPLWIEGRKLKPDLTKRGWTFR